jgi:Tfp pilus assembly protein PilF
LEKALAAPRYEPRHYPWYNLGRVYLRLEMYTKARECFQKSLELEPRYTLAQDALRKVKVLVQ